MCGKSQTNNTTEATKPVELAPGVVAFKVNGTERYFKLEVGGWNLDLQAVTPDGERIEAGLILGIGGEGEVVRYAYLSEESGLTTADDTAVKVSEEMQ